MPTSQARASTSKVGDTEGKLLSKPMSVAQANVTSKRRPGSEEDSVGAMLVVMGVIDS